MELAGLKPLLTSLAMPPLAPLLLALLGVWLAWRKKRGGLTLAALSLAALWLLSCHGTAVWLARHALPQYASVSSAQLKATGVQAIVVLGGGLLPAAPEYGGAPQLSNYTAARLRYGVWLARRTGLPLAYTGGVGWASDGVQVLPEADVATRVALEDYGMKLRWSEGASRDTSENARLLGPMLEQGGIRHVALITDVWHMPRSVAAFKRAGLVVTPAPIAFVLPYERGVLQWMPSAQGLLASRLVLRECLALAVGRFVPV